VSGPEMNETVQKLINFKKMCDNVVFFKKEINSSIFEYEIGGITCKICKMKGVNDKCLASKGGKRKYISMPVNATSIQHLKNHCHSSSHLTAVRFFNKSLPKDEEGFFFCENKNISVYCNTRPLFKSTTFTDHNRNKKAFCR
jgi:hypothetical protein